MDIVIDPNTGYIYAAIFRDLIRVFTPDFRKVCGFGRSKLLRPSALALNSSGTLLAVANTDKHVISLFSVPDGKFVCNSPVLASDPVAACWSADIVTPDNKNKRFYVLQVNKQNRIQLLSTVSFPGVDGIYKIRYSRGKFFCSADRVIVICNKQLRLLKQSKEKRVPGYDRAMVPVSYHSLAIDDVNQHIYVLSDRWAVVVMDFDFTELAQFGFSAQSIAVSM